MPDSNINVSEPIALTTFHTPILPTKESQKTKVVLTSISRNFSPLKAEVSRSFVKTLLFNILALAASFIVTIALARSLGSTGLGIFSFCIALVGLLSIPARLGIPTVVMREMSRYLATRDYSHTKGLLRFSHALVCGLTVLLALGLFAAIEARLQFIDDAYTETLRIALFLVAVLPLVALRTAMLQGINRVALSTLPEKIIVPLLMLVLIGCYNLLDRQRGMSPDTIMVFQVTSTLMAFLVGHFIYVMYRPSRLATAVPEYSIARWLRSVLPFALIAGVMLFNQHADIILLGYLSSPEEVGLYRIGYSLSSLTLVFYNTAGSILAPRFSKLSAQNRFEQIQRYSKRVTLTVFLLSLMLFVFLMAFGNAILKYAYGEQFLDSFPVVWPLAAGYTMLAALGFSQVILNMTDNQNLTAKLYAATAVINVLLNMLLIPKHGATGAATATSLSYIFLGLSTWIHVIRSLDINSSILPDKYFVREIRSS